MAYATIDVLKARLKIAGDADDAILQLALDWAQLWIEQIAGRTFEARIETRTYASPWLPGNARYPLLDEGNRRRLILDDDLLTCGTLLNGDGTEIPSGGYWLEPRNETPKSSILLKSGYAWTWDTDSEVAVTGTWGYSTTADALIQMLTLRLAEFGYRSRDMLDQTTPFSDSRESTLPQGFPPEVMEEIQLRARLR